MHAHDATLANPATTLPPSLPPVRAKPARAPLLDFALDALIALATMFAMALACGIAWGAWRGASLAAKGGTVDPAQVGQPGGLAILMIALISTSAAALVTYFWRRRAGTAERARSFQQARQASTWGWVLLTGLATFAVSTAVGVLSKQGGIELQASNITLLQGAIHSHPWLLAGFAVLLAPMYEELLFRRVLFGRLWAAGKPWLGALLSAAAFALLHELPGQDGKPLAATALLWLAYGFMGLAFAWVYRRTGTLWAAIGAHALNNLIASALLFAQP